MDVSHGLFDGGSLLCGNITKGSAHGAVDGAVVVEEISKYLLH